MEKIWLKSYPQGVPEHLSSTTLETIPAVFARTLARYPEARAASNLGVVLTYRQLGEKVDQFAAFLQKDLKLVKGDRFALMMPNVLQYLVALYAALKLGIIIVNVNPLYTPKELAHQLKDAGAKGILVLSNFAYSLEQALPELPELKHILITDLGDEFPSLKRVIVNFVVKYIKKLVPAYRLPQAMAYRACFQGLRPKLDPVEVSPTDLAFLQYTGGTTGVAKGAMLTHRNMALNAEQAYQWCASALKEGQEVMITALPLYHVFSLLANCFVFMRAGSEVVLITNPRDIKGLVRELGRQRFTAISGVNTLFNALNNYPEFAKLDFSHLKVALGGGMAVLKPVADQWKKITGVHILEAFGMTETSPAVTINPITLPDYNGSVGLPICDTEVKIIDDQDQEVGIDQAGELCIRGPQVMSGYWKMPEETAKVMMPGSWLRTGDIAKIDAQGFVYIVDRKKDMVVISGFNVYPNEVEGVLMAHPWVKEAAVIGIPDPVAGEALKAFIVRKNPSLTGEELIAFCRQELTHYKVPKIYEFRTELPKSNVGKILRKELRQPA